MAAYTEIPDKVQDALAVLLEAQFRLGIAASRHRNNRSALDQFSSSAANALTALVGEIRAAIDGAEAPNAQEAPAVNDGREG